MMRLLVILSFVVCNAAPCLANTDSLWAAWNNTSLNDSLRMDALANYAWDAHLYTNPDSSLYYAKQLKSFAEKRDNIEFVARAVKVMAVASQVQGKYDDAEKFYAESIEYTKKRGDDKGLGNIYFNMGTMYYMKGDPDNAIKWYLSSLEIREKISDSSGIAGSLNNIGGVYNMIGEYNKSIHYFEKSLEIKTAIGDNAGAARTVTNIGIISYNHGDYANASKYFTRGLKMSEAEGDKNGTATALINLGNLYNSQSNAKKAIDYFEKGGQLMKESGNLKGYASALNNIGSVYRDLEEFDKALEYYDKCAELNIQMQDRLLYASTLNNMGLVFLEQKRLDTAMYFFDKSLFIKDSIGDKEGIINATNNLGAIYLMKGQVDEAIELTNKALYLANEIDLLTQVKESAGQLWKAYKVKGNYSKSLEMYELFIESRDSIASEKNEKEIIRQEYKYKYEKQATSDSIKSAEESKVKDALLAAERAENKQSKLEAKQQEQQKTYLFAGLALAVLFGGFVFNRYRVTNKQKGIIEEQKEKVDAAYDELEEKNTEILDSINYAKRIQSAILPPDKLVKEYLSNSFILYKPKDIVAGDFYWMETKSGKVLFAAADCTGHGVPGAMVSVVCNNGLNRSVREHGLTDPGQILDKTRQIVIAEFEKSEEEVKDGMDVAICSLEGKTLKYAGAHNPLWIIRKGGTELEEIKANKQPIGKYDGPLPYTTHTIELNEGDSFYIFSDGYADQFGGEKGKKFKAAKFKRLLLSIQSESLEHQKELIDEAFENWKGDLEQLDDVCVIGVRV